MAKPKVLTEYDPVVKTWNNEGYSACALVGINSVLLGWSMDESIDRKDFMGFAVNRSEYDRTTKELLRKFWLNGKKRFKGEVGDLGLDVRSDQGPFQRFRWSDYTVHPSRAYTYEVFPMFGKPHDLKRAKPLYLNVLPSENKVDDVSIYTNRGVTAAYAYLQRFGNLKPEDVQDGAALRWLSRGLKESLIDFIDKAKNNEKLKIAIYEFHDEEVAAAIKAAKGRGVNISIVYDAGKKKSQEKNEHLLKAHGLKGVSKPRKNVSISHNKYVIHLKNDKPVAVWTGTSNFSSNAFYKQTNQAFVIENKKMAKAFDDYFAILLKDPQRSKWNFKTDSAQFKIEQLNIDNRTKISDFDLNFSPTSKKHVVQKTIDAISKARSAIFVSSPFGLDKDIIDALVSNKKVIIEYGLVNSTAKNKIGMLKNNNSRFVHPSRLETYMGRAWDAKAFGAHKIHSKSIVVDPWSNNPTTVFGSANFSDSSSRNNDENMLISNNPRMAAVVASEFLRMYDHYRSRMFINDVFKGKKERTYLEEDGNKWTKTAFDPKSNSFKYRDRLVFSGRI
ncbi:MAG: hypothetical protein HKO66_07315 [Saprospiraceae bacterium]|nr:hypothetical protein [Bacteroidia bacterium]NNL92022.1 hypothetical protein [Saprospiraceae bacterium]